MKNTSALLIIVVLIPSILIGYWVGLQFESPWRSDAPANQFIIASSDQRIPATQHGQRIILVISLDQIKRNGSLPQGIWLLTYFPGSSELTLLPIYPAVSNNGAPADSRLASSFDLTRKDGKLTLSSKFIQALKARNYEWSGYILLDATAQQDLFKLVGAGAAPLSSPTPPAAITSSYQSQANEINLFCQAISSQSAPIDWGQISSWSSEHFVTDLNLEALLEEWQSLMNQTSLHCNLPLITSLK